MNRSEITGRIAVAVAALSASPMAAQEPEPEQERPLAVLAGRVVSATTGAPLEGAVVSLLGSGYGALTDSIGNFLIPQTFAGSDTVEVRFIGYTPSKTQLTLEPRGPSGMLTNRVIFLLSPSVVRIAELTVEVTGTRGSIKLAGFEERRMKGFGVFYDPIAIRNRNPRLSSDMLRGLPGVTVGRIEHGQAPVYMSRGARGDCPPALYLDGVYQSGLNVDDIPIDDLGAMEIYRGPSETPGEYQRTSGRTCGAVVIWTPDGPEFTNYERPPNAPPQD